MPVTDLCSPKDRRAEILGRRTSELRLTKSQLEFITMETTSHPRLPHIGRKDENMTVVSDSDFKKQVESGCPILVARLPNLARAGRLLVIFFLP